MATGRGGKRPGAGRPKGSRNKLTTERKATLRELVDDHVEGAVAALVQVYQTGSDAAKVAAATAILDRRFGKPSQAVELSGPGGGPVLTLDPSRMSTAALHELLGAMCDEATDPHE